MNKFNFNPFQYQGNLSGENYAKPAKLDISSGGNNPPAGDALPNKVQTNFTSGNLDKNGLKNVAIAYNFSGTDEGWKTVATVGSESDFKGKATFPKGAKAISIAFKTTGWFGACKITPATKICKDSDCTVAKTITAKWSSDGKGECGLE